ncbi:MAG: Ig-like domain-containing protein [Fibrobacteria bacterium]
MNRINSFGRGGSAQSSGARSLAKTLVAAACAFSLAFVGCSQKAGKSSKVVVPTNPENPDTKQVVTKLDSLVKANAGKGKGVVTGFLTGEGKSIAQGLLKQASNAGGERRLLQKNEIPLTGATILIFDALKPTTSADTSLKTDSAGTYTCVLKEGKYFGFAVYLDLETFQLVTTSIPNMNPKADTIIKMDTATAIEDVTAPTVAGVYDANSANADGIFLVGSVPDKNAKLNITFSEPMNRESAKGVILGRIDTSNTSTSMVLADTVKEAKLSWSGDSKELTIFSASLSLGAQYGLIIPTTLKDLAKNPLEKEYKATFVTIAAADLAAIKFAVAASFPADKESIKPVQNPGVSFNRPVEIFSVLKGATIDPVVNGYWEVSGARAVFIHKEPLAVGKTYTVTLPKTVADLAGAGLESAYTFAFTVKDYEGAAKDNTGKEKDVALTVEAAFDAYLSGDVGRFGAAFHQNFRLYNEDGEIKSKTQFLDMIRADVGERQAMAAGFGGPVFDNSEAACKDNINRWKVSADGGTSDDEIWVDAYVNPGQSPRAYDKDKQDIASSSLTWDPTGPRFTYKGKKYGFGPDMSKFKGPVNMDAARGDMRFMGDLLKQTSTVVLEAVKREGKDEFKVDPAVTLAGDTARLAVKMISTEKFNRLNFGDFNRGCNGKLVDTSFQILKFTLINDGSKWLVISIVSPSKETNRADFDKAVDTKNFQVKHMLPITLVSPLKDNAQGADGKVTFKFKASVSDSIGGYLVGIAEDPKFCFGRPPYGALIFVKSSNHTGAEETLVLNSAGGPEGSNAASILRRVQDFRLPGWERTVFENAITSLYDDKKGFGGVYNWKVIGIKDTSAVSFLANGFSPERYYAESDFGPTRGYFACKTFPQGAAFATLETAQQNFVNTNPPVVGNSFSDMDQDGVPDGIEIKYKTDPKDRNSFPNFRVDTDGDGLADFLEAMLDAKGADSLVLKKTDAAGVKAEIEKLRTLGIVWEDTDADGFPNEIEMMYGFNPNDPKNNPGTTVRANAPSGVFAGKFQVGSNTNSISLKLYTDTSKAFMVKYTAVIGKDTLIDSLKTVFNEMSGEVYIPIILPMNGPDAGRALLMRGHYDPNTSLLMGPVDMITAPVKGSLNFGSGPYVGQFAASGRGEDVSRYLPSANGITPGTVMNNPINPVNTSGLSYRLPPTGTNEGGLIILAGNTAILIDDFGDTLAVVANLNFRGQPDGSFEFAGNSTVVTGTNSKKLTDVGGRIQYDGKGSWVVDGHLYQQSDSAGVHKSIPGQFCGRADKAGMAIDGPVISGTMKGWIAQDKTGNGFVANPVNTQPACDPARGPCNTQPVCDPAKGPCNTQPACDPAKGPCNTQPVVTNPSFNRTFMAGARNYRDIAGKFGYKVGEYVYVSLGGQVFRAKLDSVGISDAKAPLCGQVVLTLEAIPAKSDSAQHKDAFSKDEAVLRSVPSGNKVFAIEDQYMPGNPARMDKARDNQGEVRANVFVVEFRPVPAEYGMTTMVCQTNNGPIVNNPVCDPLKQTCPQPICDPAKGACGPVDTTRCDPTKATCTQPVCDPTKSTCPQPNCDPANGPCGPATGGFRAPLYMGELTNLKTALLASSNMVGVVKDSTMTIELRILVNPGSMAFDAALKMTTIADAAGASKFLVLSEPNDPMKLMVRDGVVLVFPKPNDAGNTNPPVTNPPVADTTRPIVYKGTFNVLDGVLHSSDYRVKVQTPNGLVDATINDASLKTDGTIFTAAEFSNSARIFVFIGDKIDPTKPAMSQEGFPIVSEKPVTAGP